MDSFLDHYYFHGIYLSVVAVSAPSLGYKNYQVLMIDISWEGKVLGLLLQKVLLCEVFVLMSDHVSMCDVCVCACVCLCMSVLLLWCGTL